MTKGDDSLESTAEDLNFRYHELMEEYYQNSNVETLQSALRLIREAVDKTSHCTLRRSDARADYLNNLGRCQRLLSEATGAVCLVDEAVEAGRLSLAAAAPISTSHRTIYYSNLSDSLCARYLSKGIHHRNDFEESVAMARMAVASSNEEDNDTYNSARSTLASRLGLYYELIDPDDKYLNEAIDIGKSLVRETPETHPKYGTYLFNLAGDLKNRFARYGAIDDLVSAKECYNQSIHAFPPGHMYHIMSVRVFADVVVQLADTTNESLELDDALQRVLSVESARQSETDLAKLWYTKSEIYNQKYQMCSNIEDLHSAVKAAENALGMLPSQSLQRESFLKMLGTRLRTRAEIRRSMQDMDAAIECCRQAVELAAGTPARQANALNGLGIALSTKYDLFGGLDNLNESLATRRRVMELLPQDHRDRPTRLHALGISLRDQYEVHGDVAYLNESIDVEREAADSIRKGDPDRSMILDGLSHSLSMRSKLTGNSHDLEEAIAASRAAVDGTPAGNVRRPSYLNGLCNRLISRFDRFHNEIDLDHAIVAISEAISMDTKDSSSEAIYSNTLSNSLHSRYEASGDVHDLDLSIEAARNSIAKVSLTDPFRIGALHNLGIRLQRRYDICADKEERYQYLKEAYDLAVQCVDGTPEDHPDIPGYLVQLATRQLYLATFMDESDEPKLLAELGQVAFTFKRAFDKTYATPLSRIRSGEFAGYLYMQLKDWNTASSVLSESAKMFPHVSPLSLDENDRQRQLRGLSGISSLACASFIALDQPESALEILEAGRGIMANIAMGYHADLSAVEEKDPQLHATYVALRGAISRPLQAGDSSFSHGKDLVAKRNAELSELQVVEERIRHLPGFEDFNRGLSAKQLRELAIHGPVISFCTVDQRCDALLVTTTAIQALHLPQLSHSEIKKRIPMVVGESRLSKMPPSKRAMANREMRILLAWLWDTAVQPVLKHLELLQTTESDPKARVWWVTSGPMGLLPLSAAGRGANSPMENTYAHVISSFVSTFSALAFARRNEAKVDRASSKMALITMPQTAGGLAHLNTEDECRAIQETFDTSTTLNDTSPRLIQLRQPSALQVLRQLRSGTVDMLHLACHAEPDPKDPSNTSLLFGTDPSADTPDALTVRELRRIQTSPSSSSRPLRLAYLSACCTAQQYNLHLIDENIHLATAFQLSGFPAVVGTLWEADDDAAVMVARTFYERLFRLDQECRPGAHDGSLGYHVAKALHVAIDVCRRRRLSRGNAAQDALAWAGFVHIGA